MGVIADRYNFAAQLPYPPIGDFIFERVFAANEAQLVAEMSSRAERYHSIYDWMCCRAFPRIKLPACHPSHYSP